MFKKLLLLAFVLFTVGCSFNSETIKDYTDRSLVYGWLDIDDVDGNRMYQGHIKQYKPVTDKGYWSLAIDEFKDGFLLYHYGVTNGSFKLDSVKMQSCLGFLCNNVIYTYDFGVQGLVATVKLYKPGNYHLGNYKLIEEDTGFFETSKFGVIPAKKGPSKKEMLEYLLTQAPDDHPIVTERIKRSLKGMR